MSGFRERWGKKAMLDDVSDLIFLFVAAVVLLLLVGFFSIQNQAVKEEKALGEMETKEMESLLLDYLRMPVEGKGTVMDMVLVGERDLGSLDKVTHQFFDRDDCVMVVISFIEPEWLESEEAIEGVEVPEGSISEDKIFHCDDEGKSLVFGHEKKETGKVKLDYKTKIWLEYFPNE